MWCRWGKLRPKDEQRLSLRHTAGQELSTTWNHCHLELPSRSHVPGLCSEEGCVLNWVLNGSHQASKTGYHSGYHTGYLSHLSHSGHRLFELLITLSGREQCLSCIGMQCCWVTACHQRRQGQPKVSQLFPSKARTYSPGSGSSQPQQSLLEEHSLSSLKQEPQDRGTGI